MGTSKSALAAAVLLLAATPLHAQSGDGFLFGGPRVSISLFGGLADASANSDVFGYVTDLLTLDDSDFNSFTVGGRLGAPLSNSFELTLSGAYLGRTSRSEFRDWVDQDDLPIEQRTQFARVPLLVGGRYYPMGLGDSYGSFAWVPKRIAPHIGAAVGGTWYRFKQEGDFVDFEDLGVFSDHLESEGIGFAAEASAGVDVNLTSRSYFTLRGAYLWANSDLNRDFQGFEPIDLGGYDLTAGVLFRF